MLEAVHSNLSANPTCPSSYHPPSPSSPSSPWSAVHCKNCNTRVHTLPGDLRECRSVRLTRAIFRALASPMSPIIITRYFFGYSSDHRRGTWAVANAKRKSRSANCFPLSFPPAHEKLWYSGETGDDSERRPSVLTCAFISFAMSDSESPTLFPANPKLNRSDALPLDCSFFFFLRLCKGHYTVQIPSA